MNYLLFYKTTKLLPALPLRMLYVGLSTDVYLPMKLNSCDFWGETSLHPLLDATLSFSFVLGTYLVVFIDSPAHPLPTRDF